MTELNKLTRGFFALILERFPPASYGPMILVFTAMNGLYLLNRFGVPFTLEAGLSALALMISAFLRLRLFDEIKDYEVDLKINPARPLARGALKIDQVKVLLLVLIAFEIILTSCLGMANLLIHMISIAFSLLMYEEFFIGKHLRPHLTTYAITHTFVSVLLGLSAGMSFLGPATTSDGGMWTNLDRLSQLHGSDFLFFLNNWFYFNLFEFARKTFSKEEERPNVDTYSSLFGPIGAALLSLSQAVLGLIGIFWTTKLTDQKFPSFASQLSLGLLFMFAIIYVIRPSKRSASLFRTYSGLFLILQYAILSLHFIMEFTHVRY